MAINKFEDPRTGDEITIIDGVVSRITIKENKNKQYNTHMAYIDVDGETVRLGLKIKEGFEPRVQYITGEKPNTKYHTLVIGDKVKIEITKASEWNDKTFYDTSISRIRVTGKGEVPVQEEKPKQQAPANNNNANSHKPEGKKIFGTVESIDDNKIAVVNDAKLGEKIKVDVSEQAEVVVGGRMAAFVGLDGKIVNNFKWYPPKTSNGVKKEAYDSPERQFKISFGNMVNVAALAGADDVFDMAKELFFPAAELRKKLLEQFKGSRDEGDIGGKLGDALKHSASSGNTSVNDIITEAEKWVLAHIKAEEELKAIVESGGKVEKQKTKVPESNVVPDVPVEEDFGDGEDFEFDDLPF